MIEQARVRQYTALIAGPSGSSFQTEDHNDNDQWADCEIDSDSDLNPLPPTLSACSLAILQAAISGEAGFDAGDDEPDELLRSLLQAVRGDPVLCAPMAAWAAGEEVAALDEADDINCDDLDGECVHIGDCCLS